ncbi:hypothetical protein CC86DRAFT_152893 [Ophiobolus disseminans]|uniref:Uncharacterized protein n=1 Tax=Ophiobolus disseminans TaxID=1469910 RepID=A0A6A6ZFI0_9PLEO|nr:hypothetical protein CC86DRAFT_152893 [Ophiobolus disseminans]
MPSSFGSLASSAVGGSSCSLYLCSHAPSPLYLTLSLFLRLLFGSCGALGNVRRPLGGYSDSARWKRDLPGKTVLGFNLSSAPCYPPSSAAATSSSGHGCLVQACWAACRR